MSDELNPDEDFVTESGLIIPGEDSSSSSEDSVSEVIVDVDNDEVLVPNKPVQEMNVDEQKALADRIISEIDDHAEGLPNIPLNFAKLSMWSLESFLQPPDVPGGEPQPAVILTLASAEDPRGTPHIFTRDRALKLASQLKKFAQTGPSLAQRAAQSGIAVPPSADGKLIVP